jgi:hypothetical protein
MFLNSWNFPCWIPHDQGPSFTRNRWGQSWQSSPTPFSSSITAIFGFLIRSGGWTSTDGEPQTIGSIGYKGATEAAFRLTLNTYGRTGQRPSIGLIAYDTFASDYRYNINLGDENGTDWLDFDKWYMCAVSINNSECTYAMNGTNTPKVNITTNNPGDLNLNNNSDRAWMLGPNAAFNLDDTILATTEFPTVIVSPAAYSTGYIDLTNADNLSRIYDSNGQFKNPGIDGSGWFPSSRQPEYFFVNGTPQFQKGSDLTPWVCERGGGAGFGTCQGGLKKQYEDPYPEGTWMYLTLAEAEASGDAWQDGDEIRTTKGNIFIYRADAAVSGYSGLIHKYPFGTELLGTLQSTIARGSEAEDSDPDTWTDLGATIASGTQGVDWDTDVNGGLSRLRNITDLGWVKKQTSYTLLSSETEAFRIIDRTKASKIGGPSTQSTEHYVNAYKSPTEQYRARINIFPGATSGNWHYEYNSAGTLANLNEPYNVESRVWLYVKAGRMAIWIDDNVAPSNTSFTNPATVTADAFAATRAGDSGAGAVATMYTGTDVFGSMTTA